MKLHGALGKPARLGPALRWVHPAVVRMLRSCRTIYTGSVGPRKARRSEIPKQMGHRLASKSHSWGGGGGKHFVEVSPPSSWPSWCSGVYAGTVWFKQHSFAAAAPASHAVDDLNPALP